MAPWYIDIKDYNTLSITQPGGGVEETAIAFPLYIYQEETGKICDVARCRKIELEPDANYGMVYLVTSVYRMEMEGKVTYDLASVRYSRLPRNFLEDIRKHRCLDDSQFQHLKTRAIAHFSK